MAGKKRKYIDKMHLKHYFCINLLGWGRKAGNRRSREEWYKKG